MEGKVWACAQIEAVRHLSGEVAHGVHGHRDISRWARRTHVADEATRLGLYYVTVVLSRQSDPGVRCVI